MNDDDFSDWQRPAMARGHFMFGGMPVVITENIPREHIGDEIVPRSRALLLLRRILPKRWRPSAFRRGAKIEEEQCIQAAGKLFVTPAGWEALARARSLR